MAKSRQQIDPKMPDARVVIVDFPGMSPGTNQNANEPGASYFQVNAVSLFPGELRVRRGYRVVRFDQPPRTTTLFATASSSYTLAPAAGVASPRETAVAAGSSYVVVASAPDGGSFNILGMI